MRISVIVELATAVTIEDTGYTRNMTLPEIESWAASKVRSMQLLVKEGALDPKPVTATFKIKTIKFAPGEE